MQLPDSPVKARVTTLVGQVIPCVDAMKMMDVYRLCHTVLVACQPVTVQMYEVMAIEVV